MTAENSRALGAALTLAASEIPRDVINLIPEFNGDTSVLTLFLRKCEFVLSKYQGTTERNEYLLQVVTSKLRGRAASLINERGNFSSYTEIQDLLVQHFGDPRSEECLALELATSKLRPNESYIEFCKRLQELKANLFAKVEISEPEITRDARKIIYDDKALKVFMCNLPLDLVKTIRQKKPATIESALTIVLEEINFAEEYNMHSKLIGNGRPPITFSGNNYKPLISSVQGPSPINHRPSGMMPAGFVPSGFKPQVGQFGFKPTLQFQQKGNPHYFSQNYQPRPHFNHQPSGFRPQAGQFGYKPQPLAFRPPPNNQSFGFRPQPGQFGFRPPQPAHFGYRPQPSAFRPQPAQFGYKPPNQQASNDVSMRTAPARPQQLPVNEICTEFPYEIPYEYEYNDLDEYYDYNYNDFYNENVTASYQQALDYAESSQNQEQLVESPNNQENKNETEIQNFQIGVKQNHPK